MPHATGIDRSVPFDAEAERRTLAALLIDKDAIFKVADRLAAEDFYVARHQRIYSAIQAILDRQERIDEVTVRAELSRRDLLQPGDSDYIGSLPAAAPTALAIDPDANEVRNKSLLRRLAKVAEEIARDAYDEPVETAELLDRAEQRLFALRDTARQEQLRHIRFALQNAYVRLDERRRHPTELSGVPSGFTAIDSLTEGFSEGDLVIVAARPSVGKTSLSLGIAFEIARHGVPALLFSLEMDRKQIVTRLMGLTGTADILGIRTENILQTSAAAALQHLPIYLDDTPGISIMEIRTKARRISAKEKLGLIVVDYLQLMRTEGDEENRVQEIATITRSLKALARELSTVVIALSQLSRAAGDYSEPRLSTLRESGAIEQDADLVIMLWRDKEEPPVGAPRLVHGSLAKNRNGPVGQFELLFEAERARFFDRADDQGLPT